MNRTWTLYSNVRGFYESTEPGCFAAITTQGIAGRLDCRSGKRALPKNRIFLRHLSDMPKGFRACQICRPEIIRVGDRLGYQERRAERLQGEPHVALWATGMLVGKDQYEPCRWYVAMNWHRRDGKQRFSAQHTLSPHTRYHKACSVALSEGRRFNLPVIKHSVIDVVALWLPTAPSTKEQRLLVKDHQRGTVLSLHSDGVIEIAI